MYNEDAYLENEFVDQLTSTPEMAALCIRIDELEWIAIDYSKPEKHIQLRTATILCPDKFSDDSSNTIKITSMSQSDGCQKKPANLWLIRYYLPLKIGILDQSWAVLA